MPAQPDPAFDPFKTALQTYVDQTQPFRKIAAQEAEKVPGKAAAGAGAEQSVRTRQNSLADALRTKLRPNAKQGDLVTPAMAAAITQEIENAFNTPKRELILDELAEQNGTPANAPAPTINQQLSAPRVPPRLIEILPPLPQQLEYDFVGRTLVLRDVDADVVVDYIPNAIPAQAPQRHRRPRRPSRSRPARLLRCRCRRSAAARCSRSWATADPAISRSRRSRRRCSPTSTPRAAFPSS